MEPKSGEDLIKLGEMFKISIILQDVELHKMIGDELLDYA